MTRLKILLLLALVLAAGSARADCVWPETCGTGGGGTQLDTEYALLVQDAPLAALSLVNTVWTALDDGSVTWTLVSSTSACFSEVSDGVLRYDCAEARVCQFTGGVLIYGSTIPALDYVSVRVDHSTDNGSTFTVFGGTSAKSDVQITADSEYSALVAPVVTQTIVEGERFRLAARHDGATGDIGAEQGRISVICPGGTKGTDGTDADFATDGATNENVLAGRALVTTEASSTTLTTLDMSGSIITNSGAAGSVTYTLGAAQCTAGMQFTVLNAEDGQTIVLDPYSTVDQIINLTDAAGDSVTSDGVNTSAISCQCIATGDWFCTRSGSWTDTN